MADHAPAARRGAAVGLVVLAAVILAGVWLAWRYAAEGEHRDAIHVFQYCLLLVIAAAGAAAVEPRSGYALLGLAVLGTAAPWVGLDRPGLFAAIVAVAAVGAGAYGALRKSRAGIVTGIAALVLSALGLLLIL